MLLLKPKNNDDNSLSYINVGCINVRYGASLNVIMSIILLYLFMWLSWFKYAPPVFVFLFLCFWFCFCLCFWLCFVCLTGSFLISNLLLFLLLLLDVLLDLLLLDLLLPILEVELALVLCCVFISRYSSRLSRLSKSLSMYVVDVCNNELCNVLSSLISNTDKKSVISCLDKCVCSFCVFLCFF